MESLHSKEKKGMYMNINRSYSTAQELPETSFSGFGFCFSVPTDASVVGQNVIRHGLVSPGIRACVAKFVVCS
jgi:hypothetical protein